MKRKKREADTAIYKFLRTLCNIVFLFSFLAFIFLFFYKDIKPVLQEIKNHASTIKIPKTFLNNKDLCIKTNPSHEKETKIDPEIESYQKILLAYDLRDNLFVSRLIVEFLSTYPKSKYANKVRLIGVQMMNDRGDFDGSFRYIRKIISDKDLENNDYLQAVILLGEAAYKKKQHDSYIQSILEEGFFRSGDAEKSKISFYLGYQMLYKGELQEALRYFNNVSGEDGILGRAEVYIAKNMSSEAILVLENFLENYQNSKNYDKISKLFIKQTFIYARICSDKGYLNESENAYKKVVKYFSNNIYADEARIKLADILYRKGNKEEALQKLKEILQNDNPTKHADALFVMGNINFEIGKQEEALKNFRSILEDFPESSYISKSKEWINLISESIRYM